MARSPAGRTALRWVWATGSYQVTFVRLACRWWSRVEPTGQIQGTQPVDERVRPSPQPPRDLPWWPQLGSTGQEQGTQPAESRVRSSPRPPPGSSQRNRLWWRCSRPAGLAPAAPGGRRGRRPTPPGPGSRAAAGGPAGTRSALDAARERRGIGRVAATTAGPRPGAGARTRRRHRRRGRSMTRGGHPHSLSA